MPSGRPANFAVRFPDDFPNAERRGEEQRLRIHVVDRRMKELPALDDAFARSVGEFETVEALRARIRADLEEEAAVHADSVATVRLLDAILEANPFEVPLSMVERYIDGVLGDTSKADPAEVQRAREEIRICRARAEQSEEHDTQSRQPHRVARIMART
jgi:FKBP-type peptidyl-prolyl cis-trans isomerase (trigger factor)